MTDVHMKLTIAEQIRRDVEIGNRMRLFTDGGHAFRGVLQTVDEEQLALISDLPPSDGEMLLVPTEKVVAFSRLYY